MKDDPSSTAPGRVVSRSNWQFALLALGETYDCLARTLSASGNTEHPEEVRRIHEEVDGHMADQNALMDGSVSRRFHSLATRWEGL